MSAALLLRKPYVLTLSAWILATLSVVLVLIIVSATLTQNSVPEPRYQLREINAARLPPPPPPAQHKQQQSLSLDMTVKGDSGMVNAAPHIDTEFAPITPPDNVLAAHSIPQVQLPDLDWQGFSLSELDVLPELLSPVSLNVPATLKRQLGEVVRLRLQVTIDPQGNVRLLRIVDSPSPELRFAIEQMVNKARFSAPQKDGRAVTASFIWPLEVAL